MAKPTKHYAAAIMDLMVMACSTGSHEAKCRAAEQVLEEAVGQLKTDGFSDWNGLTHEIETLYHERLAPKVALVKSAEPLKAEELARITATLGEGVEVKTEVDPSLIGGVRVEFGDKIVDGTVKATLEKMRKEIV